PLYSKDDATPFIDIDERIETLEIHNVSTKIADVRPLVRIGPKADVRSMGVGLTVSDPTLLGKVLKLEGGGHIDRLTFALDWQGAVADESKNAILENGGTITHLQWIDTPPMYVEARAVADGVSCVDVVLN